MKKFTVLLKEENGNYIEKVIFAEKQKDLGEIVAVVKSERVKHPSPDLLQRTLLYFIMADHSELLTLENFYTVAEKISKEMEEN